MGNRAVITSSKSINVENSNDIGVYLHWNGGYESVASFLKYCELKGYRPPDTDCYGWAMLCNVITNFFGDGLSCGVEKCNRLDCDNYDNGVYIIEGWRIVNRAFNPNCEDKEISTEDMIDNLIEIDQRQPKGMQIGIEKVKNMINTA